MRHLLVISAVICAVISNGWAQSRGSSRYTPSEQHFDEDATRAPRPTRGAGVRRQRITTKAPETAAVEEEVKAFQPADNPVRTTARRVPQRGNLQQVAPPPPPSLPVDDAVPRFAAPAEELSPAPPAVPESRPPGTRRRRPKKRRRPQNTVPKEAEETEKQVLVVSNEEKTSLSDLINEDKKRNGVFQSNPSSRNSLPTYNSDSVYQAEKSQWENKQSPEFQNNAAGSKYYEPQPVVNRLPVGESEPVGNSRGYLESSPAVPGLDVPTPYVSPSQPKDTSYVPILNPVRVPSDGSSRLPLENYPTIQNKDNTRLLSNPNIPLRGHSNRSPTATLEEIPRAKPVLNIIPQSDGPSVPVRSYSEVRLPEEQPLISSPYVPPTFDSSEDLSSPNSKISEDIKDPANPSNRLPNPSEIHYDSTYPEFSGDQVRAPQRVAGRRQESDEPIARNPLPSYTIPRRDVGTKPHEYDNDAEVDRRQVSQYRPPLQRAGSRFKSDDPSKPIERSREQIQPQSIPASRTRGTSRYQPSTTEYIPEKTRTRSETEPQADSPTRSRSSSTSQSSTRTRGPQRFTSDTVETVRRTTPRKPPVDVEEVPRNTATTGYIPIEEFIENEEKSERTLQSPRSHSQSSRSLATDKELDSQFLDKDSTPLRGTLRSRPQYEIRTLPSPRSHSQSSRSKATDKELDSQFLDKDSTPLRGTLRSQPQHEIQTLPSPRSHSQSSRSIATDKKLDSQFLDKDSTPLRGTLRSQPQHEIHTLPSPRSHSQSSRSIATDKELETRYLDKDTTPLRGTLRSQPQYETREADPTDRFEESIEEPDIYRPDYHLPPQANSRSRLNQAAPYPNQPAPQPAYQLPPNRQQNRPESHYESPQNYRSRQQPEYQAPQNPRTDSRQANSRQNLPSSGTQSRSRHQSEPSATSPRNSAGRNDFECPDAFGFFADPVQCDKYYECRNGTAEMHLCSDGLGFNQVSSPKFLRCDSLRDVDCSSRPELQEPQSTQNCPRRFGLFPHETDCTKFWNCVDGVATEVQCPPGLTYSDERATCDWADLVESSCKSEDLLGFTCPEPTAHDLLDGVYARYPNPDNCQLHFTCIKGADGLRRPRMLSCNEGLVFDPVTSACRRPEEVPGCENFYGGRSQTPNKKPARREPEPISEEIVEEPTPRPRRRGPNRRVRS